MQTRFEHAIRELEEELDSFDLSVILRLANGEHPILTEEEITEAEKIINKKAVNIFIISIVYYQNGNNKNYNLLAKAVWKSLGKKQWELLEKYYRGWYKDEE